MHNVSPCSLSQPPLAVLEDQLRQLDTCGCKLGNCFPVAHIVTGTSRSAYSSSAGSRTVLKALSKHRVLEVIPKPVTADGEEEQPPHHITMIESLEGEICPPNTVYHGCAGYCDGDPYVSRQIIPASRCVMGYIECICIVVWASLADIQYRFDAPNSTLQKLSHTQDLVTLTTVPVFNVQPVGIIIYDEAVVGINSRCNGSLVEVWASGADQPFVSKQILARVQGDRRRSAEKDLATFKDRKEVDEAFAQLGSDAQDNLPKLHTLMLARKGRGRDLTSEMRDVPGILAMHIRKRRKGLFKDPMVAGLRTILEGVIAKHTRAVNTFEESGQIVKRKRWFWYDGAKMNVTPTLPDMEGNDRAAIMKLVEYVESVAQTYLDVARHERFTFISYVNVVLVAIRESPEYRGVAWSV
ncbi:hypothetical protein BDR05DRAFT_952577 [Suillus weaverae]|nr:hypothetical protein BDR05DRAFT_952577 [Suillus weaverae]